MPGLRRRSGTAIGFDPGRVKLLLDANLSPRLVAALGDLYPGATHVREVDLQLADDDTIWDYARAHGMAIVSKDGDFRQLSFLLGAPPKVIWLRRGNCSTKTVEAILRQYHQEVVAFFAQDEAAFLALG